MVQMPYDAPAVDVKIAGCPQVGLEEAAVERRLIRGFREARLNEAASICFQLDDHSKEMFHASRHLYGSSVRKRSIGCLLGQ